MCQQFSLSFLVVLPVCQQGTYGSEIFIYKDTVGVSVQILEVSSLPQDGVSATFTLELDQHGARAIGFTWRTPDSMAAYNFIRQKRGS